MKTNWIYDLETYKAVFTYTGLCTKTGKVKQFQVSKYKNELLELVEHFQNEVKGMIGFNNLGFDYPIIHMILERSDDLIYGYPPNEEVIKTIFDLAQDIISCQNSDNFAIKYKYSYWDKDIKIPQLDLFKIYHFDNRAKMTSLKSLEIFMNWHKVQDLPIPFNQEELTQDEINKVLEYNLNDVLATNEFYKLSKEKINIRIQITKKYNLPCMNYSDSKIGESLILELYSKHNNKNPWDVKKLRTHRDEIKFNDIIFDYIKFESKEFNKLLTDLRSKVITKTKDAFSKSIMYKGIKYQYGTGGLHSCCESGVYDSNDNYIIIDADVQSLYPNIAIKNRLYIEHLGETFIDLYDKDIVQERIRAKKSGEMSISDALKLAANSVYGKSNDKNSFLFDSQYTMATTLNGQLLLTMLVESLVINIKDILILQTNTDGITVRLPKDKEELYYKLCKKWEQKTKLDLEYVYYSKMVIRDVNNYLSVTTSGKVKNKGCFEVDKVIGNEPAFHKDNSFKVIPFALQEYFVKGIPIEETINNHNLIYDFCGRFKCTFGWHSELRTVDYDKTGNPYVKIDKLQKTNRYYVSTNGGAFLKCHADGREQLIEAGGNKVTIFNDYIEKSIKDYNIDYSYYILEANKIIRTVQNQQLTLF